MEVAHVQRARPRDPPWVPDRSPARRRGGPAYFHSKPAAISGAAAPQSSGPTDVYITASCRGVSCGRPLVQGGCNAVIPCPAHEGV